MRYNIKEGNVNLLLNRGRNAFESDTIMKTLQEVTFNNRKMFLLFQQELFDNVNEDDNLYLLEVMSNLFEPEQILDRFRNFLNTTNTEY